VRTQLVDGLLADLLQDVRFLRVQIAQMSHIKRHCQSDALSVVSHKTSSYATHVESSQLVNKMYSQQACGNLVNKL
jgi:hypothetical protein